MRSLPRSLLRAGAVLCAVPAAAAAPLSRADGVAHGLHVTAAPVEKDIYRIEIRPSTGPAPKPPAAGGRGALRFLPDEGRIEIFADGRDDRPPLWSAVVRPIEWQGESRVPGLEIEWRAAGDEFIGGLGERFDGLNQNGRKVRMWIRDEPGQGDAGDASYFCVPVVFSGAGYALFAADNPEGEFDFNSAGDGLHRYRRAGREVTLYLAAGRTLKDLLAKRMRVRGPGRGIPDWAWGPWISRNSFENQDEAEEAIRGMAARGIPVAAIVQEAWKGRSETGEFNSFSPERWPRLDEYFSLCREHGIRTILWEVPIVHPASPHYGEGVTNGYFVKKPDGSVSHRTHWLKGFANVDFTNPRAVAWWKGLLRPVVRRGISGFKADDGEAIQPDDVFSDGRRGWQVHNEYATLWNRSLTELLEEEGVDGLLWARSGSLGMEKCPALWAGDQRATWQQLRSLLPAGLSAGLSGMPFWGHDIGGYLENPSPELYIRWVQFGAFSPLMQYHGIARREPWEFGKQAEETYKLLAHVRMNLRPTLIALGREAARTGWPIMRPMRMEFPDDPRFDEEETQYMLGPDLLVAPVLEEGATKRIVKFPAGTWRHLLKLATFEGPRNAQVGIGLGTAPVFVRQGAALKVELDPGAELGTWRPGAPVRTIAFR